MRLYLGDGEVIGGGDLLNAIYRTDLVPVPVSLELVVKATDRIKPLLQFGQVITTAASVQLTVVKSETMNNGIIKDGKRVSAIHVIAALSGLEPLLGAAVRATSLTNTSFNEVYRALGAKIRIKNDVKLEEFICLKGQLPTERIALALQREACVVRHDEQAVSVLRINDLFNQDSKMYDPSAVQWIDSPSSIEHNNVNYLSIDDDGTTIVGDVNDNRSISYHPQVDARQLFNMRRVLITKASITRQIDEYLQAGRLVTVGDNTLTVLTSAHRYDSGALGGPVVTATKAWLARLQGGK